MESAEAVAEPDRGNRQDRLGDEDVNKIATLTDLFNGVAKDTPAIIIPQGNERSVSYAQLDENVRSFQRELASEWTSALFLSLFFRELSHCS